jgi:hypothetical protein
MNPERPLTVSVIDPITPAIDRVKLMLFKPFDLGRWFTIGFCAWLASFGSGPSGGGPNFGYRRGTPQVEQQFNNFKEFAQNNLEWLIPVGIVVIVLFIAIGFLFVWLSSRGKFMLLHCIAGNKAEVVIPWAKYREHALSLFLFRVVFGLVGLVVIAVPTVFMIFSILIMTRGGESLVGAIVGIVFLGLVVFVIAVCLGIVIKLTTDFVVPIMFMRNIRIREAWAQFMQILSCNKGRFVLYLLFQIVIGMVIGLLILVLCLVTCCCAGCFLILPYIGTVLLLPIHIFNMAYALYYLRQFGPQFDVFNIEAPVPVLPVNPG